ncbi:hypothetical protein QR680_009343 [Steinernema hermaphroditum]|uniref:Uncharacterized protein n=1 Tax=Steinernema hermaphroditum TaxID=289476 RepID=A0AA39IJY8_9BILA|nr:hypothetical protein QR680_009343 [Steinernema hermaphroditum]
MALSWLLVVLVIVVLVAIFAAMVIFLVLLVRSSRAVRPPDAEAPACFACFDAPEPKMQAAEVMVKPLPRALPEVPTITITKASFRSHAGSCDD